MPDKVKVTLATNRGPITLQLDGKAVTLHVKSFMFLDEKGFYDGTSFHRHADLLGGGKGYIIQGGDPLTRDASSVAMAGMGGPGYVVPMDKNCQQARQSRGSGRAHQRSRFGGQPVYSTQEAVPFLDEGDGYTVFGKVVDGKEAALKLTQGDILQSVKVEESAAPRPKS